MKFRKTAKDLIYIAGLFDGEGSISLSYSLSGGSPYRRTKTFNLRISLSQKNTTVLYALKRVFGGFITNIQWVTTSRNAEQVLKLLLPYLRLKRRLALLALEYRKTVGKYGINAARDRRRRDPIIPSRILKKNFRIKAEIERLNVKD